MDAIPSPRQLDALIKSGRIFFSSIHAGFCAGKNLLLIKLRGALAFFPARPLWRDEG
jgi:hypothetical protein